MTVLVTGGAGYIGSHMVLALVEAGESVVVIDNLSTGFSAFLPEGVPLFIGDAGDENLVEGVISQHKVESIIHFAGFHQRQNHVAADIAGASGNEHGHGFSPLRLQRRC